ncbi:MAG TPA: response regulator [bacterium]|nr:response regulator [bacterium]
MAREHILVVDDEEDLQELLRYNLEKEGFSVTCVSTGEDALAQIKKKSPSLVLLDLMLPGIDGFDVCRKLKSDSATSGIPVVMLTAKGEDADIVAGLELGADDYATKPFSPKVLVARVRSVLRRKRKDPASSDDVLEVRSLKIDSRRRQVKVGGKPVDLTATEFALIHHLAGRPGWVFTRGQLIDAVRGGDYPVTERSIDVQIAGLRKKLGSAGREIETVHGVGYRFKEGK